ncbi:tetratricopeptide repeat protein [Labilibacter marinus]|uniref:tetratricopeptide repeat protein n=1 Tax=Labilibacter marinus TaxID=1477105 RepID=UPI00094F8C22|nr:hypothetical protein [Labilibacter marinus]
MKLTRSHSTLIIFAFLVLPFSLLASIQQDSVYQLSEKPMLNDSILMHNADSLMHHYQYDKAIDILEQLIVKDSSNIQVSQALENLYFKQSQFQSALTLQDKLINEDIKPDYYNIRKGLSLKKMGLGRKSLNILIPTYLKDTTNSFLSNQIGDLYKSVHKKDSAIYYYNRTCQIKANPTVMIKAMDLYIKSRLIEEAVEFYHIYYKESFANNQLLQRLYGKTLYHTDSINASLQVFTQLNQNEDSSLMTNKYLGMSNWKLENYRTAIKPLEQYITKDTTDFQIYYMLGSCFLKDNYLFKPKESLYYLNKALNLIQADGGTLNLIYNEIALNYQRTQQYDKELEIYLLMKGNAPDSKYVDYKLATLYDYGIKDKKEALGRYEKLLSYYEADTIAERKKSDIEKFCKSRIEELKEEEFWEEN